jgi:hypothetical protein
MGHGIDPRLASRRSGWHLPSKGSCMLPAAPGDGSRSTTRRRMADGFFGRVGRAVLEGRAHSKEMVRGVGQAGLP